MGGATFRGYDNGVFFHNGNGVSWFIFINQGETDDEGGRFLSRKLHTASEQQAAALEGKEAVHYVHGHGTQLARR